MQTQVAVPLRAGGKKMRKRKELDALARRAPSGGGGGGGLSSQDGLLSESTDEERWRARRAAGGRPWARRRACWGALRACSLVLVFACVVATTTVMWLFVDVREQAAFLRNQLDQVQAASMTVVPPVVVVAGSQGVPEALQKCHTMSKQLQQNQTSLSQQLTQLTAQLNNFTNQVTVISTSLSQVEERLKKTPELINIPHNLDTLTNNIAELGSQIKDMMATVEGLKEADSRLTETTKGITLNVTQLSQQMGNWSGPAAAPTAPPTADLQAINATLGGIRANLTLVNDTLSHKLQWLQDDYKQAEKTIVSLQERSENTSAQVASVQKLCATGSSQLTLLNTTLGQLTTQVSKREEQWTQLTSRVGELASTCSRLEGNTSQLSAELSILRQAAAAPSSTTAGSQDNYDNSTALKHNHSSFQIPHVLAIILGLCFIFIFVCYWFL